VIHAQRDMRILGTTAKRLQANPTPSEMLYKTDFKQIQETYFVLHVKLLVLAQDYRLWAR
jgi:hypothetical protein